MEPPLAPLSVRPLEPLLDNGAPILRRRLRRCLSWFNRRYLRRSLCRCARWNLRWCLCRCVRWNLCWLLRRRMRRCLGWRFSPYLRWCLCTSVFHFLLQEVNRCNCVCQYHIVDWWAVRLQNAATPSPGKCISGASRKLEGRRNLRRRLGGSVGASVGDSVGVYVSETLLVTPLAHP